MRQAGTGAAHCRGLVGILLPYTYTLRKALPRVLSDALLIVRDLH